MNELKYELKNFKEYSKMKNIILSVLIALMGFGVGFAHPLWFLAYGALFGLILLWYNRTSGLLITALSLMLVYFIFRMNLVLALPFAFQIPTWFANVATFGCIGLSIINLFYVNDQLSKGRLYMSREERMKILEDEQKKNTKDN